MRHGNEGTSTDSTTCTRTPQRRPKTVFLLITNFTYGTIALVDWAGHKFWKVTLKNGALFGKAGEKREDPEEEFTSARHNDTLHYTDIRVDLDS
jgi:hypothetical protein